MDSDQISKKWKIIGIVFVSLSFLIVILYFISRNKSNEILLREIVMDPEDINSDKHHILQIIISVEQINKGILSFGEGTDGTLLSEVKLLLAEASKDDKKFDYASFKNKNKIDEFFKDIKGGLSIFSTRTPFTITLENFAKQLNLDVKSGALDFDKVNDLTTDFVDKTTIIDLEIELSRLFHCINTVPRLQKFLAERLLENPLLGIALTKISTLEFKYVVELFDIIKKAMTLEVDKELKSMNYKYSLKNINNINTVALIVNFTTNPSTSINLGPNTYLLTIAVVPNLDGVTSRFYIYSKGKYYSMQGSDIVSDSEIEKRYSTNSCYLIYLKKNDSEKK